MGFWQWFRDSQQPHKKAAARASVAASSHKALKSSASGMSKPSSPSSPSPSSRTIGRSLMSPDEKKRVLDDIEHEGLHYTFESYDDYSDIKDPNFHRLRHTYLSVAKKLLDHLHFHGMQRVLDDIEREGLHYTFESYDDYSDIKDPNFHQLRRAYLSAAKKLMNYLRLS